MNKLREHNGQLKTMFELLRKDIGADSKYDSSLDYIDSVMRANIGIEAMRNSGTFFTGDTLSLELINSTQSSIDSTSFILDPTCGAGNLLIAASRKFPVQESLKLTLSIWGKQLFGFDLYESFVEATKLRIILDAINRGCVIDCNLDDAMHFLSNIKVTDAMAVASADIAQITHIVMNPPFCLWESPESTFWKKGKVNAAAIIYAHYLEIMTSNTELLSILPDVLRSGSRYKAWREHVSYIMSAKVSIFGQFNKSTDVDIFIITGKKGYDCSPIDWMTNEHGSNITLSMFCNISVGRVVAYRDPEIGQNYPFIHPRNVPMWGILSEFSERRCFDGTVIKPPFVVIRRTSRPGDKYRAIGTIITGVESVAVENHLIIVQPHTPTLKKCQEILALLKHDSTNNFLNSRIRCRHLTVEAIKQIPYPSGGNE